MNDKELLELAAKAAGLLHLINAEVFGGEYAGQWNPLDDDGDALRLAVKLNITVHPGFVYMPTGRLFDFRDYANQPAATRRAIVRAAAEIGRGIE